MMENTEKMKFVATCLFGMEKFICDDIKALGYEKTDSIDGRVFFDGDESAVARCNMWLRTAECLYIEVGRAETLTFDELFEAAAALPWERYIGATDTFPVSGHCIKSKLFSIPNCQKIIKKAIVKRLSEKYGIDWFEESGALIAVEFFIFKDIAYFMIDTSGTGLHKRGYRPKANEAPLRETLACGMINVARLSADTMLWDPLCGSGTIPIEAARKLNNIAPGIDRTFAFEQFPWYGKQYARLARQEAEDGVLHNKLDIYASDIDENAVELAKANAVRARVGEDIRFFVMDVKKFYDPKRRGTVITNPPYGERLMTHDEALSLYKTMGRVFSAVERWHLYILCGNEGFEDAFGKKADKVRKLYNGMIKCNLYEYFKR